MFGKRRIKPLIDRKHRIDRLPEDLCEACGIIIKKCETFLDGPKRRFTLYFIGGHPEWLRLPEDIRFLIGQRSVLCEARDIVPELSLCLLPRRLLKRDEGPRLRGILRLPEDIRFLIGQRSVLCEARDIVPELSLCLLPRRLLKRVEGPRLRGILECRYLILDLSQAELILATLAEFHLREIIRGRIAAAQEIGQSLIACSCCSFNLCRCNLIGIILTSDACAEHGSLAVIIFISQRAPARIVRPSLIEICGIRDDLLLIAGTDVVFLLERTHPIICF